MQYTVVSTKSSDELTSEVNYLLAEGWRLQGNLCVAICPVSGATTYAQALTRQ